MRRVLLQINATANWGSTGKIVEQIGLKAQSVGWDNYVVFGRKENLSELKTIRVGNSLSVLIHYLLHRLFDKEGFGSRWATKRLIKQIRIVHPTIIHLHNIHDHWINYGVLFEYLNSSGIPLVWTFHDCWSFTGHCAHYVTQSCKKWVKHCENCPQKGRIDNSRSNFAYKQKLFCGHPDLHIVTVSRWLAHQVELSFFHGHSVEVISNGIDLATFVQFHHPNREKGNDHLHYILGVATAWSDSKGLNDFIRLSERIGKDIQIVLVGLNTKQIQSMPQRILALPRTKSQRELINWYNKAEIVLSLSYAETFGLTIAEGMACGTPAIVYDNTALPELITPKTGAVVKTGDIDALVGAIYHLIDNPLSPSDCRQRAELFFNKEVCFDNYLHLYESLVGSDEEHIERITIE